MRDKDSKKNQDEAELLQDYGPYGQVLKLDLNEVKGAYAATFDDGITFRH